MREEGESRWEIEGEGRGKEGGGRWRKRQKGEKEEMRKEKRKEETRREKWKKEGRRRGRKRKGETREPPDAGHRGRRRVPSLGSPSVAAWAHPASELLIKLLALIMRAIIM